MDNCAKWQGEKTGIRIAGDPGMIELLLLNDKVDEVQKSLCYSNLMERNSGCRHFRQ